MAAPFKPHPEADDDAWQAFVTRLYAQSQFAIKLGLEAMGRALDREDHPDRDHDAILVAGTNGKGGTASFLAGILQAHGLRCGLYTSPHILDLRERFRVDGRLMTRGDVLAAGRAVLERYGDPDTADPCLTFFELTTLMAVRLFAAAAVDVAVYEVGLGGRLDATNALDPALSVVAAVDLDHTEYLGETIEAVAAEKAGIFRLHAPAVIGRQSHPEGLETLRRHAPPNAAIFGEDFGIRDGTLWSGATELRPTLSGRVPPTRLWNAATALAASRCYLGARFDARRARAGLENSRWPGRLDERHVRLPDGQPVRLIVDAAHNPAASQALFDYLDRQAIRPDLVVFAGMADKDLSGVVAPLAKDTAVVGVALDSPRAASADRLRNLLADHRLAGVVPPDALPAAIGDALAASADPTVLVFGSIYLIGAVFTAFGIPADSLATYAETDAETDADVTDTAGS